MSAPWSVFVDTGGTFTDALARSPDGELRRAKVLSTGALRGEVIGQQGDRVRVRLGIPLSVDVLKGGTFTLLKGDGRGFTVTRYDAAASTMVLAEAPDPECPPAAAFEVRTGEEAPILAARILTNTPAGQNLPPLSLRLGTTLATNALLTGKVAATVLLTTSGFQDLLEIGTQQRPDLFALRIEKAKPLHQETVEVPERLGRDGTVLLPPDLEAIREGVERLKSEGVVAAAVALLHSDVNQAHEKIVKAFLLEAGFSWVSCSSELSTSIRLLPRATTAVVDAALGPVVRAYLAGIRRPLAKQEILVMTSAGGLTPDEGVRPKDLLLSGPAGGVVGAARAGHAAGFDRIITFDMGGTSTDVARFDGKYDYVFEHRVGDAHLLAPALAVETVAAGGGSICAFDGSGLCVGPESAGAFPGPACYGASGPLTLTDVNLLLGRIDPGRFEIPVSREPAEKALKEVIDLLGSPPREEVLDGFLAIANERMAEAIRRISVRKGYDPRDFALLAFGGAGGQHACAVAERLKIRDVVVPPDAGLLSAFGLEGATLERFRAEQILKPLAEVEKQVTSILERLDTEALAVLNHEEGTIVRRIAELRFQGQETSLQVEILKGQDLYRLFRERYQEVYGHVPGQRPVELVSLRVKASTTRKEESFQAFGGEPWKPPPDELRPVWFNGTTHETPCFSRSRLGAGAAVLGPALVFERHSATVVEPGWELQVTPSGALVLHRSEEPRPGISHSIEAAELELFTHRFEALAREMGESLRRTAVSTNVKERLDFSCALLDADGELVVNAPHIPVHLGSMGLCVRSVAAALPLKDGDMALTNHPAYGGSHLPDLTVAAPVWINGKELAGYVAARAHHAEIGGTRPGSMPPEASCLAEEGVVIPPMLLARGGEARLKEVERLLTRGPWPTRGLGDNMADIQAAMAACHRGAEALKTLVLEQGLNSVTRYMAALKDLSEARMREALKAIPDGTYVGEEFLDDGTPLCAKICVRGDEALIDFSGSGPVHKGNLNATPAIVQSAMIYVLRLLVAEKLPLNEGLLRPVTLNLPQGILNPPFPDDPHRAPSIVGGNVETSQRLVDTLLKALGLAACSQGTMNNILIGNDRFSYYETLCGGGGAGPGFPGADAVHTHMTNTAITDPEVMEHRYPLRVLGFTLRRGSGGRGRFQGGQGVVRVLEFLAPLELSLLTQHRNEGPYGLEGGGRGMPGRQRLIRKNGAQEDLAAIDSRSLEAGDRLVIETPGGGAYGGSGA